MKQQASVFRYCLIKKVLFKEMYPPAMRQAVTLRIILCDRDTKWLTPITKNFLCITHTVEHNYISLIVQ